MDSPKEQEVIEEISFVGEGGIDEPQDLELEEDLILEESYEEPKRKSDEEIPSPELKPLPKDLKYRFLDDTNRYPIIISSNLIGEEEEQLMTILMKFRKAFGYSMDDLKGISPSIATHRIFMEEGAQPVTEFSRRLKPEMKEVVRK